MRPAIKAGLRSFAEAEKAYMRQLLETRDRIRKKNPKRIIPNAAIRETEIP
jgi:hypothetical protein